MSEKVQAELEVTLDASQANSAADALGSNLEKSFAKSLIAVQALTKVFEVLSGQFKDGLKDSIETQKQLRRLDAALTSTGQNAEGLRDHFDALAGELEKTTGYTAGQIRQLETMAISMGVSADRVDEYVTAAIRFANVTNQDVNGALRDFIQLEHTGTTRNAELRSAVSALSEESLKGGAAIDTINASMRDQLGLLTQGSEGAARGLTNAWGNFREEIVGLVTQSGFFETTLRNITGLLESVSPSGISRSRNTNLRMQAADAAQRAMASGDTALALQILRDAGMLERGADGGFDFAGSIPQSGMAFGKSTTEKTKKGGRGGRGDGGLDFGFSGDEPGTVSFVTEDGTFVTISQDETLGGFSESGRNVSAGGMNVFIPDSDEFLAIANSAEVAAEQTADAWSMAGESMQNALGAAFSVGIQGMIQMGITGKGSAAQIAASMLDAIGQSLLASGTQHLLQGTFAAILGDPRASAMIGVGTAELAAGASFSAAGAAFGGGGGAGAGAYGGRVASGGGGGFSGYSAPSRQSEGSGDRVIRIEIQGPMSPAETGVWVKKALDEAEREGRA